MKEARKEVSSRTGGMLACPAWTVTSPVLHLLSSSQRVGAHMQGGRSVLEMPPAMPSRMHPLICFCLLPDMRKDDLFSDFDACCILMKIKIPFHFLTLTLRGGFRRDRVAKLSFLLFFFDSHTSFRFHCLLHQNKSAGPAQI